MQSSKPKLQTLESLRGIAAICVVYFHSEFTLDREISLFRVNSEIWVDFFFILSGFVMGYAYFNKIDKQHISFKKFITLRFGRLVPLNTFILICWVPYVLLKYYAYSHNYISVNPSHNYNAFNFFSNLFLIQSFNLHNDATWNGPSWSISTEFYTYIFLFAVTSLLRNKIIKFSLLFSIIVIASFSFLFFYSEEGFFSTFKFGIFRCIGGFFLGLLVYFLFIKFKENNPPLLSNLTLINISETVLLLLIVFFISNIREGNIFIFTLLFIFSVTILVLAIQHKGLISKILLTKPLLFLGKISYSIYLTHALVLLVFTKISTHYLHLANIYNQELERNFIFFKYANMLNLLILIIIIFVSKFTYKYIELPYRDRFIKLAKNY
jgi:peptidoglycan/LPS O-acetylase OafA/YrhL